MCTRVSNWLKLANQFSVKNGFSPSLPLCLRLTVVSAAVLDLVFFGFTACIVWAYGREANVGSLSYVSPLLYGDLQYFRNSLGDFKSCNCACVLLLRAFVKRFIFWRIRSLLEHYYKCVWSGLDKQPCSFVFELKEHVVCWVSCWCPAHSVGT